MIIIIINGTARELTNNGEQMIPSWPKKKKKSVRLQKIKQILSWQFKTQMPQPESVSGFLFLCGELKVQKSNYFQLLHCHMKQNKAYGFSPGSQA